MAKFAQYLNEVYASPKTIAETGRGFILVASIRS